MVTSTITLLSTIYTVCTGTIQTTHGWNQARITTRERLATENLSCDNRRTETHQYQQQQQSILFKINKAYNILCPANSYSANLGRTKIINKGVYIKLRIRKKGEEKILSTGRNTTALALKMTTAQVFETSVTDNNNSPIQDYVFDCVYPDDHTQPTYETVAINKETFVVGPK